MFIFVRANCVKCNCSHSLCLPQYMERQWEGSTLCRQSNSIYRRNKMTSLLVWLTFTWLCHAQCLNPSCRVQMESYGEPTLPSWALAHFFTGLELSHWIKDLRFRLVVTRWSKAHLESEHWHADIAAVILKNNYLRESEKWGD